MDYATDEERVEEIKRWWKENGKSVIFGVVLGLSILFGWRWWGDYQEAQAFQASGLYTQLQNAVVLKKKEQAEALHAQLLKEHNKQVYAVYASLAMGKMKMDANEDKAARAHIEWAYQNASSQNLKNLSGLRLARLLYSLDEIDAAHKVLTAGDGGKYMAFYEELKGDIYLQQGKREQAREAFIKASKSLPSGVRVSPLLQFKIDDLATS